MPTFKLILVGDGGVGKTTFVKRHLTGEFEKKYVATLGVEVHPLRFHTNYGPMVFNVWDTAGQEKFRSITRSYYRGAAGALLVYDITRRETFDHLTSWLEDCRKYSNQNLTIMLVGNKSDLETKREVSKEEGEAFAAKHELFFLETSAKTALNVENAFLETARKIYEATERGGLDFGDQSSNYL